MPCQWQGADGGAREIPRDSSRQRTPSVSPSQIWREPQRLCAGLSESTNANLLNPSIGTDKFEPAAILLSCQQGLPMHGPIGKRNAAGIGRLLLRTGVCLLSAWMAIAGGGLSADPPAMQGTGTNRTGTNRTARPTAAEVQRQREAVAELKRLMLEVKQLEASGQFAEEIAALEKAVALASSFAGDASEAIASLRERIASIHGLRNELPEAIKNYSEVLAIRRKLFGENDWRVANVRFELKNAILVSRLTDQERQEVAQSEQLDAQVVALDQKGNVREAISIEEQALAIRKRILGEEHPYVVGTVKHLAWLHQSAGDHEKEELLLRQVLDTYLKSFGEIHPQTAEALEYLARLAKSKSDYAKAEPLYRRALEIRKKVFGVYHPETAQVLAGLADVYGNLGDYAKAEPLCRQALEIRRKLLGENHPDTLVSLNNMAYLYREMGDEARAEPLYRRALEIKRKVLGENHVDTALSLNNLAVLYDHMGDYAKAEPLCRQALEIRRKLLGEKHPHTLSSLSNLGTLYLAMKEYDKAEPLLRQVVDTFSKVQGENHPDTATALNNLAELYESKQEYAKAEPLVRRALEIRKRVLGETHPQTAESLMTLAKLYVSLGDYAKAEPLLRQALEVFRKRLGENHPNVADLQRALARLLWSKGESKQAAPLCRQALEITQRHFAESVTIQSERQQLLSAKRLRGDLDAYLTIGGDAGVSAADLYPHVLGWKGSVFVRQLATRGLRRRPDLKPSFEQLAAVDRGLARLALEGPGQMGRDVWEERVAELSRQKEALERSLASSSAGDREQQALLKPSAADLQRVLPPETALVDVIEYWHARPSKKKPGTDDGEKRLAAFVVRPDRPIVRVELGPVKPLAAALESWRNAILRDGGGAEPDDSPAHRGSEQSPQELLKRSIWSPLRQSLEGARVVLISPDGVLNQIPLGALPGDSPGRYLIEEIKLATVPVPRLLLRNLEHTATNDKSQDAGRESLLIVGDVSYGVSKVGSQAGSIGGGPGKADGVAVADVRSAGTRAGGLRFVEQDSTRAEVAAIRETFKKEIPDGTVTALGGDKATESEFRREASQHRWLHLATQGFFAPPELASALGPSKQPQERSFGEFTRKGISGGHPGLLSGIALAGANTPAKADEDDGILTAVEAADLDLQRAELVVLSGGETGLGTVAAGEGVLGLERAFQLSGAKTTIASLWKVADRATMPLMQRFYENLWGKKLSKLDALREAQLWMLKEGRSRGLEIEQPGAKEPTSSRLPPRYWAAFVLSGDWR
jgi:CHAT domain-containing protein/tetratricopeptide (TPR) repeat protein